MQCPQPGQGRQDEASELMSAVKSQHHLYVLSHHRGNGSLLVYWSVSFLLAVRETDHLPGSKVVQNCPGLGTLLFRAAAGRSCSLKQFQT